MKKILLPSIAAAALLAGCAAPIPHGIIYTEVQLPVSASSSVLDLSKMKSGKSFAKSYVGMVAIGDASISTAKKNGGVKKVSVVDWKAKSILGIIGEYETTVYGE